MLDPALALPHRPPARLLTRVVEVLGETVRALGRIEVDSPGATSETAPAILGLELGAQCAAMIGACAAQPAVARGVHETGPRIGYLVSIRSARLETAFLPVGRDLEVEASRVGAAGGLELFEVCVRVPPRRSPVVQGTVGTMLTERRVQTVPGPAREAG